MIRRIGLNCSEYRTLPVVCSSGGVPRAGFFAVPAFSPFAALRYDPARFAPEDVTAPPYDVLSAEDLRLALCESASPAGLPGGLSAAQVVAMVAAIYTTAPLAARSQLCDSLRRAPLWAATVGGPTPDACLVNLYRDGARMGLHQDRDEADLSAPVLSVSLGDTAVFRIGPAEGGPTTTLRLESGDLCALTGPARLARHGIDRVLEGSSRLIPGGGRLNLTLRRAGVSPD